VCDEIVSPYAQRAHTIILEYTQKYQIKMQILTENNQKFKKPPGNASYRTKVKIFGKHFFVIVYQKILVPLYTEYLTSSEPTKLEAQPQTKT
jgi:hypothetical protein